MLGPTHYAERIALVAGKLATLATHDIHGSAQNTVQRVIDDLRQVEKELLELGGPQPVAFVPPSQANTEATLLDVLRKVALDAKNEGESAEKAFLVLKDESTEHELGLSDDMIQEVVNQVYK